MTDQHSGQREIGIDIEDMQFFLRRRELLDHPGWRVNLEDAPAILIEDLILVPNSFNDKTLAIPNLLR